MQFPMWASNSADDPTFDHLIEQAKLDALWEATAPDEPAHRGRQEDKVHADPREEPWNPAPNHYGPDEASER